MPAYPYRRRRRIRRGYGRFRPWRYYRRKWRWRRPSYWRRLYWVRKRLRLLRGLRRRAIIRRRRRKFGKRRRLIGPWAIKTYWPPVRRKCCIKGAFPLLYFNRSQINLPFYDQYSQTYMGGGISSQDLDLNWLYFEHLLGRNKWSRSNYGFDYARFRGGVLRFYRHNTISYICKYYQGYKIKKNQPWSDIHPGTLVLDNEKIIVSANKLIPIRKRHHTKKLKIRRPPNMTTEWYDMCDMGHFVFLRLCTALVDFEQPYQKTSEPVGDFYVTVGYDTPDRRTLVDYDGSLDTGRPAGSLLMTPTAINKWAKKWVTWGGPINTYLPVGEITWWCDNRFRELCTQGNITDPDRLLPDQCKSNDAKPAYLIYWYYGAHQQLSGVRPMFKYCASNWGGSHPTGPGIVNPPSIPGIPDPLDPYFDGLVGTVPYTNKYLPESCSRSSHRSGWYNTESEMNRVDFSSTLTQGFWPGRYNWIYDIGKGNVVYLIYVPSSMGSSTYKLFGTGNVGPGTASDKNFETIRISQDEPYWKTFYGHTYASYLAYVNRLFPHIKEQSLNHEGIIAVGIRCFPAYKVASGAFTQGYAPLRYGGSNKEYFYKENHQPPNNYVKWWQRGTNMPPVDNNGQIDYKCWVFTLLRDGRHVMYGSSLEGSLITTVAYKNYFCQARTWETRDDIYTLGRSGPYILDKLPPDTETVVNLTCKYKFYFQWGGYHYPGTFREPEDPREECPPKPLSDGYFPGTSRSRSRRDTAYFGWDPVHPSEVSAQSFVPERDTSPGGFILPAAFKRLTTSSLSTALGAIGPRTHGKKKDNALCSGYGVLKRERDVGSPQSETTTSDSEETPTIRTKRRRVKRQEEHIPRDSSQSPGSSTPQPQGCIPCTERWKPQSKSARRRIRRQHHRLDPLRDRLRELQRLEEQLSLKSHIRRTRSCTSLY
ncbi:ORF1 [torque teno Delphinidae virus 2]